MTSKAGQVWLAIASGGKWTRDEIESAVPGLVGRSVDNALRQLTDGEMVTHYPDGRYGITHDCRIPRGMSVGEVLGAMG